MNYPKFASALPTEPVDMVVEFMKDYTVWNDFAFESDKRSGDGSLNELPELSYDALIEKYCGPSKDRQCLAYGSKSDFSPEDNSISDVKQFAEKQIVFVKHKLPFGDDEYQEFEFEFHLQNGRWMLDEIYYLDEYDNNNRLNYL